MIKTLIKDYQNSDAGRQKDIIEMVWRVTSLIAVQSIAIFVVLSFSIPIIYSLYATLAVSGSSIFYFLLSWYRAIKD